MIAGVRRALVVVLAAILLLGSLGPEVAEAKSVRYAGKTSQGYKVVLRTNAKGKAQRFLTHFDARCEEGGHISNLTAGFTAPFRRADYRGFADGGRQDRYVKKFDARVKDRIHIAGTRTSRDRLEGTVEYVGKFFAQGERYNTCRSPRGLHFSLSRR